MDRNPARASLDRAVAPANGSGGSSSDRQSMRDAVADLDAALRDRLDRLAARRDARISATAATATAARRYFPPPPLGPDMEYMFSDGDELYLPHGLELPANDDDSDDDSVEAGDQSTGPTSRADSPAVAPGHGDHSRDRDHSRAARVGWTPSSQSNEIALADLNAREARAAGLDGANPFLAHGADSSTGSSSESEWEEDASDDDEDDDGAIDSELVVDFMNRFNVSDMDPELAAVYDNDEYFDRQFLFDAHDVRARQAALRAARASASAVASPTPSPSTASPSTPRRDGNGGAAVVDSELARFSHLVSTMRSTTQSLRKASDAQRRARLTGSATTTAATATPRPLPPEYVPTRRWGGYDDAADDDVDGIASPISSPDGLSRHRTRYRNRTTSASSDAAPPSTPSTGPASPRLMSPPRRAAQTAAALDLGDRESAARRRLHEARVSATTIGRGLSSLGLSTAPPAQPAERASRLAQAPSTRRAWSSASDLDPPAPLTNPLLASRLPPTSAPPSGSAAAPGAATARSRRPVSLNLTSETGAAAAAAASRPRVRRVMPRVVETPVIDAGTADSRPGPSSSSAAAAAATRQIDLSPTRPTSFAAVEDLLRCFICLGHLERAVMCPSCSKMACEGCLKKWITESKRECPHCRTHLFVSQLVQCRFVDELQSQLKSLAAEVSRDLASPSPSDGSESTNGKGKGKATASSAADKGPHSSKGGSSSSGGKDVEVCGSHGAPLYYYCLTCADPICSDCAMFGDAHRGHEFKHLDKVYAEHVERLRQSTDAVVAQVRQYQDSLGAVDARLEALDQVRERAQDELASVTSLAAKHLDDQVQANATALLAEKDQFENHILHVQSVAASVTEVIKELPRTTLLSQSAALLAQLQGAQLPLVSTTIQAPVLDTLDNPLVPPFEVAEIVMREYETHAVTGQVFYSPHVVVGGLTWRLKVYPVGNGQARGECLSIFVELIDGLAPGESVEYQYKIVLMAQPTAPAPANVEAARPNKASPASTPIASHPVDDVADAKAAASSSSASAASSSATPATRPDSAPTPPPAAAASALVAGVTREFASTFTTGECWGYNRFYPLDRLHRDGLLSPRGTLVLQFHVRPRTYDQRCRDLARYAARVGAENADLRTRLAMAAARPRSRAVTPTAASSAAPVPVPPVTPPASAVGRGGARPRPVSTASAAQLTRSASTPGSPMTTPGSAGRRSASSVASAPAAAASIPRVRSMYAMSSTPSSSALPPVPPLPRDPIPARVATPVRAAAAVFNTLEVEGGGDGTTSSSDADFDDAAGVPSASAASVSRGGPVSLSTATAGLEHSEPDTSSSDDDSVDPDDSGHSDAESEDEVEPHRTTFRAGIALTQESIDALRRAGVASGSAAGDGGALVSSLAFARARSEAARTVASAAEGSAAEKRV
ncbi:hypothetical protein H9P43_004154 [Blastocladiella emersonii ATCC 22665]|nr:hypothetical protein H9P43_004154 [Blastocladiella emersonii ATCC 22665]